MRQTLLLTLFTLSSFGVSAAEIESLAFENVGGFIAGTIVQTEEGPDTIQNIRINDRVLSLDPKSGKVTSRRVLEIGQAVISELARITILGEEFYVNPDHRFYTANNGEWVHARDLKAGSHLLMDLSGRHLAVEEIDISSGNTTIYDLKVEDTENYFVGKCGVLVHNYAFVIPVFTWVIGEGVVWVTAATLAVTAAAIAAVALTEAGVDRIRTRYNEPTRYDIPPPPRTRNDPLPRHPRTDEPLPDPDAKGVPHTQLGQKPSDRGPYPQAREFDGNGKPVRDIDFTDHGRPQNHPNPHQHYYKPNPTGGTMSRDKTAYPL